MTKDIRIRRHKFRIVTTNEDYGSAMYRPGIRIFLEGPNGSPAGIGPKAFPLHWRIRNLRSKYRWLKTGHNRKFNGYYTWTNCIYIPVPHLKWHWAYRARKVGGLRLYQWNRLLNKRLFSR